MKIITPRKTEVTVRRPDGTVETIVHPKIDFMTDGIFNQMKKAMKDGGRGEVLAYKNIDSIVEMEESDYKTSCTRCGCALDIRTAYKQKEWTRFGGNKVQVDAYYCESCHNLLSTIGQGEITDLEHRAGYVPSFEPTHKEDY